MRRYARRTAPNSAARASKRVSRPCRRPTNRGSTSHARRMCCDTRSRHTCFRRAMTSARCRHYSPCRRQDDDDLYARSQQRRPRGAKSAGRALTAMDCPRANARGGRLLAEAGCTSPSALELATATAGTRGPSADRRGRGARRLRRHQLVLSAFPQTSRDESWGVPDTFSPRIQVTRRDRTAPATPQLGRQLDLGAARSLTAKREVSGRFECCKPKRSSRSHSSLE